MSNVILAGGLDVAELAFWAFILFFIGLVFYLRREDRREGYPLENEITGRWEDVGGPLTLPTPKVFHLPFGRGVALAPRRGREPELRARQLERFNGAPFVPTGDPLVDGVGPAAWAPRAPWPDLDMEGRPRVVPLGDDTGFFIARGDLDPRGLPMVGADGAVAGTIADVWIDRSDRLIRYLEVALDNGGRRVLVPMTMADVKRRRGIVRTQTLPAHRFADAPGLETPGIITRREEDRVQAFFGGGYLYGMPMRTEPLI